MKNTKREKKILFITRPKKAKKLIKEKIKMWNLLLE